MNDPLVYLSASILLSVVASVIAFTLGRVSTTWDRKAAASERDREAATARRLEEVHATRQTFEARVALLMAMMEDDGAALSAAFEAVEEHSGHELLRYYGSRELIERWWNVSERIAATYLGTDRAKQGTPDPAWLRELRQARGDVLAALRAAREAVAEGRTVGGDLVNDPQLAELMRQRDERDRARLERVRDARARETAARAPPAQHWTAQSMHRGEVIHVGDVPAGLTVLEGHVFEDCTIIGPAVLAFVGEATWEAPRFIVSSPEALFWTWPPQREIVKPDGVIAFARTTFRRCQFERVTIAGSSGDIARLRESLPITMTDAS